MTDTKIVTFKKEWRGYAIGEIAGFDPSVADALIESGRAKLYVEKTDAEKVGKVPPGKKVAGKASATKQPPEQKQEEEQQREQQEQQEEQQEQQENEELDEKP